MTLLVIDDDRELCSMLREFLREQGFGVEFEHDGDRGLTRALGQSFGLLILDVMLPSLDGFEVLRRLRAQSDLPVLILTARGERGERVQGLQLGADDYLSKPFDPEELLARIRSILRRATAPRRNPPEPLQVGELQLFPAARNAYFRNECLKLTAMECEVLEQLMRSCGRVVSRDQLSFQLYNRPASPFDRTLDTHVSRIRRKMGAGCRMILSVRGAGYQLVYPPDPASQ